MDDRPFSTSTTSNWVARKGGLPPYVRGVARALIRQGHTESEAIQIAIGVMKRAIATGKWASLKGHAHASTLAKSGSAVAHWEAMKLSNGDAMTIDLAGPKGYEHGWKFVGVGPPAALRPTPSASEPSRSSLDAFIGGRKAQDLAKRGTKATSADKIAAYSKAIDLHSKAAKEALAKGDTLTAQIHAGQMTKLYDKSARLQDSAHDRAKNLSSGAHVSTVDLASQDSLLPDMDSVKKAASKLTNLPPALRKSMAARLAARAKALGGSLDLANALHRQRIVDLAVDQAQRDAAKEAGLTFPGTDSYPLAGPDGKFDRGMATKACNMVGLGNVGTTPAIRKWLMAKLKANGAADLIPDGWNSDGSAS